MILLHIRKTFIDKDDIEYESTIFKGKVYKNIKFLLGKLKTDFRDDYDVLYVNIYLINNKEFIRIGIYEFNSSEHSSKFSMEILKLISNKSLLFSFVKDYINNPNIFNENLHISENLDKEDEEDEEDESEMELDSDDKEDNKTFTEDIEDKIEDKTFIEDEKTIIELGCYR